MRKDSFNSACPYYTMFPLGFPKRILTRAKKGQVILDPFCGRGTTLFAAREKGLSSIGIDTSPIAVAISKAKIAFASPGEVLNVFDEIIESTPNDVSIPHNEFWARAYHPETLLNLCKLRHGLLNFDDVDTDPVAILRVLAMGALHGPLNKGDTPSSFFSNQMMRTFATKPDYAVKYWDERCMQPPYSDVRNVIERRATRLLSSLPPQVGSSTVLQGDARKPEYYGQLDDAISWVITSPPYFGMSTYEEDQWLRLWFLGGPDTPKYGNNNQISHRNQETFALDLAKVWDQIANNSKPELKMVVRFGEIGSRKSDHKKLFKQSLEYSVAPWKITYTRSAGRSADGQRQSITMGKRGNSNSIEESDFYVSIN